MLSKDETKTRNAIKAINAMDMIDAVKAYIEGEDRTDVLDAAQVQIEFIQGPGKEQGTGSGVQGSGNPQSEIRDPQLNQGEGAASEADQKPKQGEQTEPITHKTDEFKGPGVQGTKEQGPGSGVQGSDNPNSDSLSPLPSEGEGRVRGGLEVEGADSKSDKDTVIPQSEIRIPKLPLMGQDIIEALDAKDLKKSKELALKAAPFEEAAKKTEAELRQAKGVVTCEDVLARMRSEGKAV